jgi:hypothetical protein
MDEYKGTKNLKYFSHNPNCETFFLLIKEYLYKRDPDRYARVSTGDISYQLYVKERQQCKPFKYFLDVVAPDMKERYPLDEPPEFASGAVS